MIGLPQETLEDVQYIVKLIEKVHNIGREFMGNRARIGISLSTFVPQPHTPFQWAAQDKEEVINTKHEIVKADWLKRTEVVLAGPACEPAGSSGLARRPPDRQSHSARMATREYFRRLERAFQMGKLATGF